MSSLKLSPVRLAMLGGICLLALNAGCGKSDPIPRAIVTGSVTFEGEPVVDGEILFVPAAGVNGAPVQLAIKDGRYSSARDEVDSRGIVIGSNEVKIYSMKLTGRKVKSLLGEETDEQIQMIPAKYNEATELQREITSGKQELNFDLTK